MKLHAILYSWPAVHARAFEIARSLVGHADRVTIVACSDAPLDDDDQAVEVVRLDNSQYFGGQFKKTIEVFEGDVLLQIAADTWTDSWPAVADRCAARFQASPQLGIWTPHIDGTGWSTDRVFLFGTDDRDLIGVIQTDCIVWALRRPIVDYLKTLDYACTPLGWGIDWAAVAHAYALNLRVVRDNTVKVGHRLGGSGYDHAEADRQQQMFLQQMPDDDKVQFALLNALWNWRLNRPS
ncbi:MAG TPA: hypothetical protein VN805_03410 [Caulobacteraceae bacterium]|nr:hypothetical protein [Caulobacteraceae bacterium]